MKYHLVCCLLFISINVFAVTTDTLSTKKYQRQKERMALVEKVKEMQLMIVGIDGSIAQIDELLELETSGTIKKKRME